MKKLIFSCLLLFLLGHCLAQELPDYTPLDVADPVVFKGTYLVYDGDTVVLGARAFFVDGQLSDEVVARYDFVFNSVNEAVKHLSHGTEEQPMVLYLAPYVYWIDNPDDPEVRVPMEGEAAPYGLIVECEWLRFYGLTKKAENVVLAANRGQTIGARGNFTLFKFVGEGTSSENVTFGNYCNVDLEFPLKPELNRGKRASAIVQAQLIHCNGDKIVARNTRFISRLNLCPFVGAKRVLFDACHFELTDDALSGTGVYLNSTFDFYSSKPFYWTRGTGAVFLHCDINSYVDGRQYFTKAGGQLALVDTRIVSEGLSYLGWQDETPLETRNYQYGLTLNGEPVVVEEPGSVLTVDMNQKGVLDAYLLDYQGERVYNSYNLLRGNDDWDPMGIASVIKAVEKERGRNYSSIPTQLVINKGKGSIETGRDSVLLSAKVFRWGNFEMQSVPVQWSLKPEDEARVQLFPFDDGLRCLVVPTNDGDEEVEVVVRASTDAGLEAAAVIHVAPSKLPPPVFLSQPELSFGEAGTLHLSYELDLAFDDQSEVTWYRCSDAGGSDAIKVAVSRANVPLRRYELSAGDVGWYLMASVSPKHQRSDGGTPVRVFSSERISDKRVKTASQVLHTDFQNFPTDDQPKILPGFWSRGSFDPKFSGRSRPELKGDAWFYGEGSDGAKGFEGLLPATYAYLYYTPPLGHKGATKLALEVAPFKTAGQGFSIAPLYMDVLINFDAQSLTGYALRFIRTTKFHNAVDCLVVKYEKGKVKEVSAPVSTSAFRTPCLITLELRGKRLIAKVGTRAEARTSSEVAQEVNIAIDINPVSAGGFGLRYAGGSPTLIKWLRAE